MSALSLPLSADSLPDKVRRFGDPNAPGAARMMAAKGMVPLQGGDMLTLLLQLSADPDSDLVKAATASLEKLPVPVLLPACENPLHPAILNQAAIIFMGRDDVGERLVLNKNLADATLERLARSASEKLGELIATNQQRLLGAPTIVEALYRNKNVRMSTADRLVELCARNQVELTGIASFHAHVKAIEGQLIPEPTDEPLPTDTLFSAALEESADDDEDAVEVDKVDRTEALKEKFKPLAYRIRDMSLSEKIRMATIGDAAARSLLVRDPIKMVSNAAITSPGMTANEATRIAHSKEVSEDILRFIGTRKKEWLKSYEIKRALIFNPKTPVGVSLRFVGHLRPHDLKMIARSRGIPNPLKVAAKQRLQKKQH